jgi:molybdopterin-guanine dinucleotide biosynthesis protein A
MVSVAILAGGQSKRMGRDKALLTVGGQLLIERVIKRVQPLTDDLIISTNSPEKYVRLGLRCVVDVYPGKAALGGIYSALQVAQYPYVLVVACDMPLLNMALLEYLVNLAPTADAVVPIVDPPHSEALHAVYSKKSIPAIETCLQHNDLRVSHLFDNISVRYVDRNEIAPFDPEFLSFVNVNTPDDWKKFRSRLNLGADLAK